jgi:uncharacterized protein (DUF2236 family)
MPWWSRVLLKRLDQGGLWFAASHGARLAARDGYFAPESVIRRVGNSPLVPLLGGGPAVLLQVAHPLVAAGVVEHSDYQRDLWRRLRRTLRALYLIVYGSREEAERAGEAVRSVHAHVHGTLGERLGSFPAGTRYSASDAELLLWVHATLVHSSLAAYRRFVARLPGEEEQQYHAEMAVVARLFGAPADSVPATPADFRDYFDGQLSGAQVTVTAPARSVAAVILRAPLPLALLPVIPAHRFATAALLPAAIREQYGLRWDRGRELALMLGAPSLRLAGAPVSRAAGRVRLPAFAYAG